MGFHANQSEAFPSSVTWLTLAFLRIFHAYSLKCINDDVTEKKKKLTGFCYSHEKHIQECSLSFSRHRALCSQCTNFGIETRPAYSVFLLSDRALGSGSTFMCESHIPLGTCSYQVPHCVLFGFMKCHCVLFP